MSLENLAVLFPVLVMAIGSITLGIFGLMRHRPVMIFQSWQFMPILLMFVVQVVTGIQRILHPLKYSPTGFMDWYMVLFPVAIFILFLYTMKGVIVFGISGDNLQKTLQTATEKMGEPTERSLNKIVLLNAKANIFVNHNEQFGMANIRCNNPQVFKRLVSELRMSFPQQPTTNFPHWFNLLFGLVFLMMLLGFYLQFSRIEKFVP